MHKHYQYKSRKTNLQFYCLRTKEVKIKIKYHYKLYLRVIFINIFYTPDSHINLHQDYFEKTII